MKFYNKYTKTLPSFNSHNDTPTVVMPNGGHKVVEGKKYRKKLKKQIKKYGFSQAETYDLDETATIWLYTHIKMLLDIGGKTVNYAWDRPRTPEFIEEVKKYGYMGKSYDDLALFNYILRLIEESDALFNSETKNEDLNGFAKREEEALKKRQNAFHLFALMLPSAWW